MPLLPQIHQDICLELRTYPKLRRSLWTLRKLLLRASTYNRIRDSIGLLALASNTSYVVTPIDSTSVVRRDARKLVPQWKRIVQLELRKI
jgi:hypothetical protein